MLKNILLPFYYALKWLLNMLLAVIVLTILLGLPMWPALLAADYGNGWLLLYIPLVWICGYFIKKDML